MKQNKYVLCVSGERTARQTLNGAIVCMSASLTRTFLSNEESTHFFFRYRSDARLVLRNVARSVRGRVLSDTLEYGGARARVSKCA